MESVFGTAELLEAILLRLDLTTLLVSASRVSKSWHAAITTSPSIQQALYFRPATGEASKESTYNLDCVNFPHWNSDLSEGDSTWGILNPLLVKAFGPCFFDFGDTYGYTRRASSFYKLPWTNRTAQEAEDAWEPTKIDAQWVRDEAAARRRFTRRGASWRRMLVSQPPPLKLGYLWLCLYREFEESNTVWTALWDPQSQESTVGLRMGELYDLVQFNAGHHSCYSLWFRVLWGPPRDPFCGKFVLENRNSLLAKTHALVEFYPSDDSAWANHPRVPSDVDAFDAIFRCDEYFRAVVQSESNVPGEGRWEFNGVDMRSSIWEGHLVSLPP